MLANTLTVVQHDAHLPLLAAVVLLQQTVAS
jgi:hypothetical protein